ncbi:putative nuclease HARBI1 [Calliphora vicina]|uniref:putative nuclease HARBI1 n=1 Tax=Calliphora vicina TaxID=7373 RepID=UPI00325B8BEB
MVYYCGMCSAEIMELVPETRSLLRNTRSSARAHQFVVDWTVDRTKHYWENSFFSRTVLSFNLFVYKINSNYFFYRFKKRFRVTKEAFNYILDELEFVAHLSTAVPPKIQLASTLLLLASGGFQNTVGNDFLIGVGQSTLSKIIKRVVNEMESKLCSKFIEFNLDNCDDSKQFFLQKYKIPGVIGCIDGTHFGLQKPPNEHMFFNRKGFHSLNSMIICDHKYRILAINSKYGGAAHDSFVWKQSEERILLEQKYSSNLRNFWLLGDSGYPLEPWLLTPYRSPQEGSMESRFNDIHSKARCVVERTIGILKARWKILCHDKRSRYSPQKVAKFSNVCAALHNICIHFKVPNYEDVQQTPVESTMLDMDNGNETQITKIGKKIRDNIKNSLCSN